MTPGPALRAASRSVRLPPGARMRFLEELRSDLEDLQRTLVESGVPPSEAQRRAEVLLAPDAEALEALRVVHRPHLIRWRPRVPGRWGWAGALALGTMALAAAFAMVRETASVRDLPLFLVPLAGIAVAAALRAAGKVIRIWLEGESDAVRVRSGASDLLVAAGGATVASVFGILFELYRTALAITLAPHMETALALDWLRRSVLVGAAGIAIALPCGLAWLFFVRQAAGLERRERALLGPELRLERAAGTADRRGCESAPLPKRRWT